MKQLQNLLSIACLAIAALLPVTGTAAAEELASFRAGVVGVALESAEGTADPSYRLVIKPVGGSKSLDFDLTAKVFSLEKPTRLVVDLPRLGAENDQKFSINDRLIGGIRLGAHQDKTRFVIDIKSAAAPEYNVRSDAESESLVVEFSFGPDAGPATGSPYGEPEPTARPAPTETPEEEPVPTPEPTPEDEPLPTATPEPAPSPQKAPTPASFVFRNNQRVNGEDPAGTTGPIATAEPTSAPVSPDASTVNGIYFQAPADSQIGSVAIDVNGLNSYRINQLSEETYELVLDNARLAGPHLVLPQFPPDTFTGFQVLVAREERGGVTIKIYVTRGTKLTPYIANDKLWIKAIPNT